MSLGLDTKKAKIVKRLLWQGKPQTDIARAFDVDQRTISCVVQGQTWVDVKWPDGSVGAMKPARREMILKLRKRARPVVREGIAREVARLARVKPSTAKKSKTKP